MIIKKQLDGFTSEICEPFDFVEKMTAFGFASWRIDGGSTKAISEAVKEAKKNDRKTNSNRVGYS